MSLGASAGGVQCEERRRGALASASHNCATSCASPAGAWLPQLLRA